MSQLFNGWHLPSGDEYFPKIIQGTPPKSNGFQKDHLLEAFKHVKNWRLAIDVGAHVGFWTRDMAERFDAVFAFEPAEDTFACLKKNTRDLDNVMCSNSAVGDEKGYCVVCSDKRTNTGSTFIRKASEGVSMITLDGLKFPFCDFLKVDVEGFELQVLQGAEKLIEEHEPVVIMECDKLFSHKRYGVSKHASIDYLLERGYREVARMRPDRVFVYGG